MSASRKKGLPASGSFALPLLLLGAALFYLLYHDLAGGTLFTHNGWDSYTLQADAWLHGRIALDRDYPYLELAIYQGQYYVSFPPFPAVLMLPFVLVFGLDTPNNLILAFWTVAALPALYLSFRKIGIREAVSAIASTAVVVDFMNKFNGSILHFSEIFCAQRGGAVKHQYSNSTLTFHGYIAICVRRKLILGSP